MVIWMSSLMMASVLAAACGQQVFYPAEPDSVVRLPESTELRFAAPGPRLRNHATVLFWTPCYDDPEKWFWWYRRSFVQDLCPELVRHCDFVIDKQRLNHSDAVVFMVYDKSFNLSADVGAQLPASRMTAQRWILLSLEPPTAIDRLGNLSQLNGVFNWTMSYRRDSDIYAPFGTLVLTKKPLGQRAEALERNYAANKTKVVAWFASHCPTEGRREAFVVELQKHMTVDVYGRCGTLECWPPRSQECYRKLSAEYKFYLAFENILCKDYVTEKFMTALASDVVPVVFGGADYSLYAPAGSYIDALEFPSPEALATYLLFLDGDDDQYNHFFDWKRGYEPKVLQHGIHVCNLCAKVLEKDLPYKTYEDIDGWWRAEAECRGWTLAENATDQYQ